MTPPSRVPVAPSRLLRTVRHRSAICTLILTGLGLLVVAAFPAAAQTTGSSPFCSSDLADTIRNIFTIIQFGGPLIGGVLALGATVVMPSVRKVDVKRELKDVRNQGILWGVIVAPLGTVILQFILTNVVAGGNSCAF